MASLTRRAFLGGLFTLAFAPALAKPLPGLTTLETALEELRHAHLMRRLEPECGTVQTLNAVQGLRTLGLSRKEVALYCRLTFRMARRDHMLVMGRGRRADDPLTADSEAAADADAVRRRYSIEGDIDQAMRALPWPSEWINKAG